ncbi:peptidylprolyl isomerase [Lacunimicrobium album]
MPRPTISLKTLRLRTLLRRAGWSLMVSGTALAVHGCGSFKSVEMDNPVVGPPPPRVSAEDIAVDQKNYARLNPEVSITNSGVKLVRYDEKSKAIPERSPFEDAEIIATVNGKPIMASDILERYGTKLDILKVQAPDKYVEIRNQLLKKDLPNHIERSLLAGTLKESLKKEQMEQVKTQLDKAFEEQVQDMVKKANVSGPEELEHILREQGTSLASLRDAFGSQQMAFQYLALHAKEPKVYSRSELLEYYNAHIEEYRYPAQVKYREMVIYHHNNGGQNGAADKMKLAVTELKNGTKFADVAKKFSEGSTAQNGGFCDWTRLESLGDDNLRGALINTPLGEISEVLVGTTSFQVVEVMERKEAGVHPFEEMQTKIEKKLGEESRRQLTEKVLADLKATAVIETIFDNETPPAKP